VPAAFLQASENAGFDGNAEPHPWLMVPRNGINHVNLHWSAGLSLRMRNPQIARFETFASQGRTRVAVHGLEQGGTSLDVIAPGLGAPVATLDVSVFLRKTVTVGFHFVNDQERHVTNRMDSEQVFVTSLPGSPMHVVVRPLRSHRMLQSVNECLKDLNDIFTPQTNLTFSLRWLGQSVVATDLGDRVYRSASLLHRLRTLKDHTSRINVFFVWDLELQGVSGTIGTALRPLSDGICVVDDRANPVGVTVAHEVGHLLLDGLAFHHFARAADSRMLMHTRTSVGSRKIPKRHAIHMHRVA
jgi:hypothetical protein